jgi:hypothetical protein
MSDLSITPDQALLAVEAAGLDPNRPLTGQLTGEDDPDTRLERQLAALSEQVAALTPHAAGPEARERSSPSSTGTISPGR